MDFSLEQKQWSISLSRFRKFKDLAGNVWKFQDLAGKI